MSEVVVHGFDWYCDDEQVRHGVQRVFPYVEHERTRKEPAAHVEQFWHEVLENARRPDDRGVVEQFDTTYCPVLHVAHGEHLTSDVAVPGVVIIDPDGQTEYFEHTAFVVVVQSFDANIPVPHTVHAAAGMSRNIISYYLHPP